MHLPDQSYVLASSLSGCTSLKFWQEHPDVPLYGYPVGTWGPLESEAMMREHGAEWTNPCKNLTNTDEYCEL